MLDIMNLDIESTKSDFKMEMEVPLNKLNVLVGANGSGKTLMMKFAWFAGYMLQAYKVLLVVEPEKTDELFAEMMQKVFRWTFDEPDDMFGSIAIRDKNLEKFNFSVVFKDGKMNHFVMDIIDPEEFKMGNIQGVQFNSKEARTFEQCARYIKLKKKFGIETLTDDGLDELCEFFKIYDVLWFEQLIHKVKQFACDGLPETLTSATGRGIMHSIFIGAAEGADDVEKPSTDLVSIKDDGGLPLFVMADGSEKKATSLSSGQQSMLMLLLFSGA